MSLSCCCIHHPKPAMTCEWVTIKINNKLSRAAMVPQAQHQIHRRFLSGAQF